MRKPMRWNSISLIIKTFINNLNINYVKRCQMYICPNCKKETISAMKKLSMQRERPCPGCGKKLKVPFWANILFYLSILIIILGGRIGLMIGIPLAVVWIIAGLNAPIILKK